MGGWVEILFPIAEINDPQTRAWFVDGGTNQSWTNIFGSGGTFAPGAVAHQIGTDTLVTAPMTPPPPPPPPPLQCLQNFVWGSNYLHANGLTFNTATSTGPQGQVNQLDTFNNLYAATSGPTLIFDSSGNVIASLSLKWLADSVDAWFGSAVVNRGTGFSPAASSIGFYASPIHQGNYVIAYFRAGFSGSSFANWYVILQPNAGSPPSVVGAVYYDSLLGPPYINYLQFLGIANGQSINDPIMIRGSFGLGAANWCIALLPSIAAIVGGTYKASGYPGEGHPCKVPLVKFFPIGNNNLSSALFDVGGRYFNFISYNAKSGFVLPNSSGGTNVYFYMSREYMDFQASSFATGSSETPEVKNVLQPAYPNGCIIKINMGVLDYGSAAAFAFTHAGLVGGTNMYVVDNASWNDGSSPQIPFSDEYTYLSNGNPGGVDSYIMQPGLVLDRGGGIWWIIFYMPGISETEQTSGTTLYESVRIFQYNTATEVATQILKHTCVLYTSDNIPLGVAPSADIRDYKQAWSVSQNGSEVTLRVTGYRDDVSITHIVYQTNFLEFPL